MKILVVKYGTHGDIIGKGLEKYDLVTDNPLDVLSTPTGSTFTYNDTGRDL